MRLHFVPLVGTAFVALMACATKAFDIGSNEPLLLPPKTVEAGVPPKRIYGCVDWNDDDVAAKRGPACEASCPGAEPKGERFEIKTQADVVAVTANRWMFCGGSPFSAVPDSVGMEFTPGCRIYLLRRDGNGNLVRGTEARHQASFDIYVPNADANDGGSGEPVVDLHIDPQHTIRYSLESAKCPNNWLKLHVVGGAEDGGEGGELAPTIALRPVDANDLVPPAF